MYSFISTNSLKKTKRLIFYRYVCMYKNICETCLSIISSTMPETNQKMVLSKMTWHLKRAGKSEVEKGMCNSLWRQPICNTVSNLNNLYIFFYIFKSTMICESIKIWLKKIFPVQYEVRGRLLYDGLFSSKKIKVFCKGKGSW